MSMELGMHHYVAVIFVAVSASFLVVSTLLYLHEALAVDYEGGLYTFHKGESYGYGHDDVTIVLVVLVDDTGLQVLDHTHDHVHVLVAEGQFQFLLHQAFGILACLQCLGSCRAVGHDESACAQFHASKISYHQYDEIGDVGADHLS